jgi:hypothetical protein
MTEWEGHVEEGARRTDVTSSVLTGWAPCWTVRLVGRCTSTNKNVFEPLGLKNIRFFLNQE